VKDMSCACVGMGQTNLVAALSLYYE